MKKGKLIGLAAAAAVLAAVAGGGAAYVYSQQNSDSFLPGTSVNGVDVSGQTAEQAREFFKKQLLEREVIVEEGSEEVLRLSLSELGCGVDDDTAEKALTQCMISEKENFGTVVTGLMQNSDFLVSLPYTIDEETFAGAVTADALSVPRKENQNAKILYYKEDKVCRIEPEVQGTELRDEDLQAWLKEAIDEALTVNTEEQEDRAEQTGQEAQAEQASASGASSVEPDGAIVCVIPESLYIPPEKTADSEDLQKKCEILNEYADETITYVFGDQKETLTFETIMDWIKFKDGKVSVKEDKVQEYVRGLAEKYETRYMERVFKTSFGGEVTFPPGLNEYGYTILEDQEAQQLTQDILSGESVEREPVYQIFGPWGDPLFLKRSGTDDLAGTYVEVSISAQHMWYYVDGELLVESDVVTGDTTLGQDTATGVFPLAYKESPSTLRGGEGKKKYVTKVQYWMPFYEGQGLHDAWWKSVFGGTEYIGNGSHGCVNLPVWVAETVYNNIVPGTAIVIYY